MRFRVRGEFSGSWSGGSRLIEPWRWFGNCEGGVDGAKARHCAWDERFDFWDWKCDSQHRLVISKAPVKPINLEWRSRVVVAES